MFSTAMAAIVSAGLGAAGPVDGLDPPAPNRFDVLGMQVCIGGVDVDAACDMHVLKSTDTAEDAKPAAAGMPPPWRMSLFGKHLCFGSVSKSHQCDWHMGTDATSKSGVVGA